MQQFRNLIGIVHQNLIENIFINVGRSPLEGKRQ